MFRALIIEGFFVGWGFERHMTARVVIAKVLDMNPADFLSDESESHPDNTFALFGIGISICIMFSMIVYAINR